MKWQTVKKYLIGSFIGIVTLFSALFLLTGIDYTHSGDIVCGETCESYINVTTTYWRICFDSYDGTKYENETLFKKRTRSRTLHVNLDRIENIIHTDPEVGVDWLVPTYGNKWRPIKNGDCWERGKINRIKLIGHKEASQTVKWNFDLGDKVNIDPVWKGEPEVIFTPTTDTICQDGKCTKTLWSGVRNIYEDNQWKRIENARSLKDAWKIVYLSKSDNFIINFTDYNYTSIKGNLIASEDLDDEELEFEIYTNETKFKYKFKPKDGETEFEFDTMKLWNTTPLGLTYHFDPKETWGTTLAIHDDDGNVTFIVNANDGVGSDLNAKNAEYIDFIAWNDSVPIGYRINAINFTVDVQDVDNCWGLAVQHNKTGSFVTECSWADVDAQNPLVCSFNVGGWWTQDVNDLGIRLLSSDCDGGGPDRGEIDYGYMFVDYANPTTIQLQDADTENLDDTTWSEDMEFSQNAPDDEFYICARSSAGREEGTFKFNISSIPVGVTIDSASFFAYMTSEGIDAGEEYHADAHHIYSYPLYNVTLKKPISVYDECGEELPTFSSAKSIDASGDQWRHYIEEEHWIIYDFGEPIPITEMLFGTLQFTTPYAGPCSIREVYISNSTSSWGSELLGSPCDVACGSTTCLKKCSVSATGRYINFSFWTDIDGGSCDAGDQQLYYFYEFIANTSSTYEWTEENVMWENRPTTGQFNSTYEDRWTVTGADPSPNAPNWINWTVTNMVNKSYSDGDDNVSIWIRAVYSSGSPSASDDLDFDTKESTTASQRPYLNITYSEAAPEDTCTAPASGNWDVDCSDACNWTTNQNVPGNITMSGTGPLTLSANLTFTSSNQHIFINTGCDFKIMSGGGIT